MDNHPHTTEEFLIIACRQYAEGHKDQFMPRATLNQAADTIERLQEELGLARKQRSEFAQSGLRLEAERDAALAEIERLKGELAEASGQVEWLDKSNNLLRTQIEGFK